jgi:sodium/potassium-transporting ATPase subunit alpha
MATRKAFPLLTLSSVSNINFNPIDLVGDIVYVNLGNKCPADFRLLQCSGDLKFDRSVLTGESLPISATTECTDPNFMESRNIGMQGTHVVSGNGVGLVIQTGDNTVFGRIAKLSSTGGSGLTTLQKVRSPPNALTVRKSSDSSLLLRALPCRLRCW